MYTGVKKLDVLVLFITTIYMYVSTYSKSSALYQRKVIALSAAVRNENKNMCYFWGKSFAQVLLY